MERQHLREDELDVGGTRAGDVRHRAVAGVVQRARSLRVQQRDAHERHELTLHAEREAALELAEQQLQVEPAELAAEDGHHACREEREEGGEGLEQGTGDTVTMPVGRRGRREERG